MTILFFRYGALSDSCGSFGQDVCRGIFHMSISVHNRALPHSNEVNKLIKNYKNRIQSLFNAHLQQHLNSKVEKLEVTDIWILNLYFCLYRQNGLGYSSFMGRVGVSVSPLIILLEEVWSHLPSTIFSLVAVTVGLTCYFLPETQNIRLPETIEEVENPR